jgi:hypothetical protein
MVITSVGDNARRVMLSRQSRSPNGARTPHAQVIALEFACAPLARTLSPPINCRVNDCGLCIAISLE